MFNSMGHGASVTAYATGGTQEGLKVHGDGKQQLGIEPMEGARPIWQLRNQCNWTERWTETTMPGLIGHGQDFYSILGALEIHKNVRSGSFQDPCDQI